MTLMFLLELKQVPRFFFWFFFVGVVVVFTLFTKSLWVGDIFLPTLSRAAILSFAWI